MKRFLKFLMVVLVFACLISLIGAAFTLVPHETDQTPSSDTQSVPKNAPVPTPEPPAPPTPEELAAQQLDEMMASMTTEEKVGQLFFVRCPAENAVTDVSKYHLGGYILFGRDTQGKTAGSLIETIHGYQAAASIPLLIGVDEEGGLVVRVSSNPYLRSERFLSPQKLYQAGGMDAVVDNTAEKDRLLQALGFNVNLAPVADVSTYSGDFIYPRAFGKDADATADYVSAVTAQMHEDGMGSVLKHFPGYGSNVDTHTGSALDDRPLESFRTSDLIPFAEGLKSGKGTAAVLVSHNVVKAMDPNLPASLSPAVHQLLREELGFEGVAMTDDLAMDAVNQYAREQTAAVLALQAGNDLILTTDYRVQIPQVLEALENGSLSMDVVDQACRRVLTWKQSLGLLGSPA